MAVAKYLVGILAVIVQLANVALAAAVTTTNMEDSQIMSHIKEQYAYCNTPHGEVFNIRYTLSNDTKGLVTNHEDLTHLREDAYVFRPEKIVVPRCDDTCQHIAECKIFPVKATISLSAKNKDSPPEYYELDVVEHSKCECIMDGFKPNEIVSQNYMNESGGTGPQKNGFELSENILQIDGFEQNENIDGFETIKNVSQIDDVESKEPATQLNKLEGNKTAPELDVNKTNKSAPQTDVYKGNKAAPQIDEYEPIENESQSQNSSGKSQLRMSLVVCFTLFMILWIISC